MKAYTKEEKSKILFQFAVGLHKAMLDAKTNPTRLALDSGIEKSHMQLIANGNKNVTLTTQMALAEGLKISYTELATYYNNVSKSDEKRFIAYQEKQQQLKAHNKKQK
ncbi:hypothetical protein [Niabella drilacis]|uniref:HTH cro/C1-type domain-containing protein n=1 Tax=Niabella drilacis (strain DSM 25811 / CCM 8410 / CCUG 62505 / LMG 26954 / E90) TaxID=1285928 RepID=A0A1G6XLE6_NIADE|nr:hypothetical protein [Niabella drilacis]SDD79069.1 hypothetical protein SAMN04487894_113119 [Niabella drilacis]